ncbi:unnamed protein product [Linum tenue]|uniref:Letm1 RBD domain-containing protein n=1 Tax=Linum tenue TaxID=586396 RepID=A0AAV0NMY7_9ROSI|nr:unnamed protein product [Linum tenue]
MLFNYDLALDYISRARLANMCMFMGIRPFGTSSYLRFKLRRRLQNIRKDDRMIREEGVHTLTEEELSAACRARGMLWVLSLEEMRQQLCDWLDLSLDHWVPSSLLILSRAFTVRGDHTLVLQPHKREWTPQNEFNELSRALAILASESAETVGVVEDERVAEAASYLRSTLGDTGVEHLISYFGKLYAEDIVKLVNESKLHQD